MNRKVRIRFHVHLINGNWVIFPMHLQPLSPSTGHGYTHYSIYVYYCYDVTTGARAVTTCGWHKHAKQHVVWFQENGMYFYFVNVNKAKRIQGVRPPFLGSFLPV
jgi:hypothetical protein